MRLSAWLNLVQVLVLLLLISLTACAGHNPANNAEPSAASFLHCTVMPDTFVGNGTAERFTFTFEQQRDVVVIHVFVTAAKGLKALYLDLACSWPAVEVISATPSATFGDASEVLCLALAGRGYSDTVQFGAVLVNYPQRKGYTGSGELAILKLRIRSSNSTTHGVSTPPTTTRSATQLTYETGHLIWRYYSQGDYDQNGIVNIGDLSPLGANYGAQGPFNAQLALSGVDGNGDGRIGIGDLSTIGQNFGTRVSGYHVYRSPSIADYPPDPSSHNGVGTQLLLSLLRTDGVESPGERMRFEAPISPPVPADNYWVRPYDGANDGTPSNLFSTAATAIWHSFNVAGGLPGIDEAGRWASLALVNGFPAIAYYNGEPYYVRANDSQGITWGTASKIVNDGLDSGCYISLSMINGLPAVAYYSDDLSAPYYAQATDADGATWNSPVAIEPSTYAHSMSLAEVNMRPAVAYYITRTPGPAYHVLYERAGDAGGTDWSAVSLDIDDGESAVSKPILAAIGGRPAVAYRAQRSQPAICFKRADNIVGSSWGSATEILLSPDLLDTGSLGLTEVGGTPAICFVYQNSTGSRPAYARASDVTGVDWDAPAPMYVVGQGSYIIGDWMSMVVAGGQLYCAMANFTTLGLDCAAASDSFGATWFDPLVSDSGSGNAVGDYCSMASINGYPAIAYYDVDATALKFAILY